METRTKVLRPMAFLVDGDDTQPNLIKELLEEASDFGPVTVRRVHGD